jgi:hypothetical protein
VTFPTEVYPGKRATADLINAIAAIGRTMFVAFRDASQSISDGTNPDAANAISWDNIESDLLGGWSASQPTRWTPPIAGRYMLTGGVAFMASTAGTTRGASWLVNGSVVAGSTARPVISVSNEVCTAEARSLPVELDGDDYVQLVAIQETGGALNTATASNRPFISVTYVGPS